MDLMSDSEAASGWLPMALQCPSLGTTTLTYHYTSWYSATVLHSMATLAVHRIYYAQVCFKLPPVFKEVPIRCRRQSHPLFLYFFCSSSAILACQAVFLSPVPKRCSLNEFAAWCD